MQFLDKTTGPLLVRKSLHAGFAIVALILALEEGLIPTLAYALLLTGLFIGARAAGWLAELRTVYTASYGDVFLGLGILLAALLVLPQSLGAFAAAVLVVGIADPLAALFGMKWGHTRFTVWGEERSDTGTIVFFIVSAVVLLGLTENLFIALFVALLATVLEILSLRGSDNLTLPVGVGLLLLLFL